MKIPSLNISPRVQCGKTRGKTRVSVTQFNPKLHCKYFVRMSGFLVLPFAAICGFELVNVLKSRRPSRNLYLVLLKVLGQAWVTRRGS